MIEKKILDGEPALTEEGTVYVMNKVLEKLKLTAVQMVRAAENIRQQIAQQGQQIDDERLMKMFILPHFPSALKEVQDVVCDSCDVDEDELEQAVGYYIAEGNQELKEITKKIKIIFRQFGGEIEMDDEGVPDAPTQEIGIERVIEIIQKMEMQFSADFESFMEAFQAQYGPPSTPQLAEVFQRNLMLISEKYVLCSPFVTVSLRSFTRTTVNFSRARRIEAMVTVLSEIQYR
jgi:hypothetical protein